jgi:hypothetical protein
MKDLHWRTTIWVHCKSVSGTIASLSFLVGRKRINNGSNHLLVEFRGHGDDESGKGCEK